MRLWIEVTPDEYELPLAVCDSLKELVEKRKANYDTVCTMAAKYRKGKLKFSRYQSVDVEED